MTLGKRKAALWAGCLVLCLLISPSMAASGASPLGSWSAKQCSPVQKVAVFGKDDRQELPDHLEELNRSVGLLYDQNSRAACTAFCVSKHVVATAAHCVFRSGGEAAPALKGFLFQLPGLRPRATSRILGTARGGGAQNVTSGTTRVNTRPPIDASRDWALLRLSKPICQEGGLPVTRHPAAMLPQLSSAKVVFQVSFHGDFGNWHLSYAGPCTIGRSFKGVNIEAIERDFTEAKHLILHTCDTGQASSGSPLLLNLHGRIEVAGMNVGTYVQSRVQTHNGKVIKRFKANTVANTGVSASAFRDQLSAFLSAEIIQRPQALESLQRLLHQRGHYAGAIDGIYGVQMRGAIEAFEREDDRPVTGLATASLLKRLQLLAKGEPVAGQFKIESRGLTSKGRRRVRQP